MKKKVWGIELKDDDCCWVDSSGVITDIDCVYTARISYTEQIVDIYKKNYKQGLIYKITLQKGCIWGPGTLILMSDMTL